MPVTYDNTLADDLSKVRFQIGDTVEGQGPRPNEGNFDDNEINAVFALQGSNFEKTVAALFEVLATEWSKLAISYTIGPRKEEIYRISIRFENKSREWAGIAGVLHTNFSGGLVRRGSNGSAEHS